VAAISAMAELNERGIRVPQQVKFVGYDNIDLAAHLHPTLSTIDQPTELAARYLVEGLFERMHSGTTASRVLPTALLGRESSAP
jgi:DNA-binding LacI/PurR family transcriptional regulator